MHIWSALLFKFEGGTCNACTMYASINTLLGAVATPRVDQAAVFFFQRDVSDCLTPSFSGISAGSYFGKSKSTEIGTTGVEFFRSCPESGPLFRHDGVKVGGVDTAASESR